MSGMLVNLTAMKSPFLAELQSAVQLFTPYTCGRCGSVTFLLCCQDAASQSGLRVEL